jgi:lipopolysaccharide/colanic/teichoic acid biosynthesis glycosyltransferase
LEVDSEPFAVAKTDTAEDQQLSTFASAVSVDTDVEVLVPTDPLVDTQTYHLDDTQLEFPAKPKSRVRLQPPESLEREVVADGTLALDPPAAGELYLAAKRVLDVVLSAVALIVLSPVLLVSALLVKLTDGGSVLYPHTRVGESGNEFTCYKFRSMIVNAENMKSNLAFFNSHDDHRTFKIPDDPRVTWIGRWMRRTSIDELPQLYNVLRGDMSVVGPRPPVVSEVEQYTWDDMQRLAVKPGLTCIWQVSGRSRLPFPEQLKLDLQYIENRSMTLDLKLIAKTIPAVLSADGAY